MCVDISVGICGVGFVGNAMLTSFKEKGLIVDKNLFPYDKYKCIGKFEHILESDIIFMALPTVYDEYKASYDLEPIEDTLGKLKESGYNGTIVIKSTVQPLTSENLSSKYMLNIVHNPEFLTAATAYHDFHNQKHIVLGKTNACPQDKFEQVVLFYKTYYPTADISCSTSTESECMKIFVNCYYAAKIQFFNELYCLCDKIDTNYDVVKTLMLKNGWINPMHTSVPGTDGKLSYGGLCFPKDTSALLKFMQDHDTHHKVLAAVIAERNLMRDDNDNVVKKL